MLLSIYQLIQTNVSLSQHMVIWFTYVCIYLHKSSNNLLTQWLIVMPCVHNGYILIIGLLSCVKINYLPVVYIYRISFLGVRVYFSEI